MLSCCISAWLQCRQEATHHLLASYNKPQNTNLKSWIQSCVPLHPVSDPAHLHNTVVKGNRLQHGWGQTVTPQIFCMLSVTLTMTRTMWLAGLAPWRRGEWSCKMNPDTYNVQGSLTGSDHFVLENNSILSLNRSICVVDLRVSTTSVLRCDAD